MVKGSWSTKLLESVATLQRGFDLPSRLRKSGEVPIVTSSGIEGNHYEAKVKAPGVVTGRYGTIGEVFFVETDFWPLNTTLYVRDFHGNDPLFVSYLLRTIDFHTHSGKSGVPGVNRNDLHEVVVQLPPTQAEQEAIAEALSDADALIESLEQLVAKKRRLKQGAMQELLTGKRRLPGFEVKRGYKQTEVGAIPKDWDMHRLGEGIKLTSGQHILAHHCNADGDGVAYITGPADFPNGMIRHTKYTTKPGTICGTSDILVTVKGSGAGALVLSDGTYCISRQLMAVRVLSWSTQFVFFSLLRDTALFGAAATGLIPGLSRGDILNKRIPLPPTKAEQEAIAAILSDMEAEISALETKLTKARQIKQGMMQELLTGRIRLV